MQYDCGITSDDPFADPRFRALHGGWRQGLSWDLIEEFGILAQTPGLPVEWIYAVFKWTPTWRRKFNRTFRGDHREEQGRHNAGTVKQGDGFRMLRAVGDLVAYKGAVPLWTQLELINDPRSDCSLAERFGVDRQKVRRWRTKAVFNPLTAERIVPNRGRPIPACK